jgi:predicted dehydrogenase
MKIPRRAVVAAIVLGLTGSGLGAAQTFAERAGPGAEARTAAPLAAGLPSVGAVLGPLLLPPANSASLAGAPAVLAAPLAAPAAAVKTFHFAVIGAGDVVKNYYSPAFQELRKKYAGKTDIAVTFIDASETWKKDPKAAEKATRIIEELKSWATVLDASDAAVGRPAIAALRPDAVIVATPDFLHVDKVMEWLDRPVVPKRIYVEKPVDRDRRKANALLRRIGYGQDQVSVLDHYAARLLPSDEQLDSMQRHLGGGIKSFAYYFLEDHSGADPHHSALSDRDGAIEREQRVKTLDGGMILDGLPHLFPLLRYFADLERVHVTGVRAAQYAGVDGDPDKRTEIRGETFAEVRLALFRRLSIFGAANAAVEGQIQGVAYVGKGVRGVQALGPEYDGNAKLLDVVGLNGRSIRFDLRSSSPDDRHARAYFLDGDGREVSSFPLYAKPYGVFFERILLGVDGALHVEEAERILEAIERIIDPIQAKGVLDTYEGGMKGRRLSNYLEEIVAKVAFLFNHDEGKGDAPRGRSSESPAPAGQNE